MSNKAMSWAIDATVTKSHKLVLMLIADAHNGHTGACFPSQTFLEEKSGLADSTILEVLKDLEDWGFLTRHTQSLGRGKGSRRDFELHFEVLTPGNLDLLKSGLGPPEKTPLDPRPTRPPYKDKPEVNRKEPEGALGDIVQKIWDITPKASKDRSSKKLLKGSLEKIIKKADGEILFRAFRNYLALPSVSKDDFEFVPAVHRWFSQGRWEQYARAVAACDAVQPDMLTASEVHEGLKRERWESGIAWYIESGGGWDLDAWSPPPHKPGCKAPADLLAKAKPVADWILKSTGGRV